MLTPEQQYAAQMATLEVFETFYDQIIWLYSNSLSRYHRAKTDQERLDIIARFNQEVGKFVGAYDKAVEKAIDNTFKEYGILSAQNDKAISGVAPSGDWLRDQAARLSNGANVSFTNTMGFLDRNNTKVLPFRKSFLYELQQMEMSMATGQDYYNSILTTVRRLNKTDIRTGIVYITEKGKQRVDKVETAVRRSLFGGLRQMTREQAMYNSSLLGFDVFDITFHFGNRPSHSWGGMRYSVSGSYGLPTLEQVYARGGGGSLSDWGCRHDILATVPNAPPLYDPKDLERFYREQQKTVKWEGKDLDRYGQEQQKRELERSIRAARQEQEAIKGLLDAEPDNKEIERAYYSAKKANNSAIAEYNRFCDYVDLKPEYKRIYVDGRGRLAGPVPKQYK